MAQERRDEFSQTDHEVNDVYYYKTRAYKAEVRFEVLVTIIIGAYTLGNCG